MRILKVRLIDKAGGKHYIYPMKSEAYTVSAPYLNNSKPVVVFAYDTDSATRKACVKFPAGTYLVARKGMN